MQISDSLTTYKLLILYMIDVMNYPLTNAQISDFILGRGYTDYFNIQQAISDLTETGLIVPEKVQHSTRFTLSNDGKETLDLLIMKIPSAIREDARVYLKEHNFSIRETNSVTSTYKKTDNDEYLVHLKVDEDNVPLIEINVTVPSKSSAATMCANWREQSQELYTHILTTLATDNAKKEP